MITAEHIPDEVAKAARLGWAHGPKDPIEAFRHAIAAALNAWPKAFSDPVEGIGAHDRIVLPLPRVRT